MPKSQRAVLLVIAAAVVGLGVPAAAIAFSPHDSILAATSPQVTQISIPNGSGILSGSRAFTPNQVTVVIGVNNTVTWTDNDNEMDANGYVPNHTVTANDNSFSSQPLSYGDTYTYTFTTPGTFAYHCNIHSWMQGTVVVVGVGTSATTTTTTTTKTTPEFPLPYAVLLVVLGLSAAAFTLARRGSGGIPTSAGP